MKVVHVNTNDITGGAARAVYRLHTGLLELGHESIIYVSNKESTDPNIRQFIPPDDYVSRIYRKLRGKILRNQYDQYQASRPEGCELFATYKSVYGPQSVAQLPEADIINLHWLSGFIDYKAFFPRVSKKNNIVWTIHDMNPFTGGCHYDMGCRRYLEGCGACPQLGTSSNNDLSKQIWSHKKKIFEAIDPSRLKLIVLNEWMKGRIQRSPLLSRFSVTIIPNGINLDTFRPRGKKVCRESLGIKQSGKVVLFVADSISNKRKGFVYLDRALTGLEDIPEVTLLSVGKCKPSTLSQIEHVHLGVVNNDSLLSEIYSAADIFIIPSLQDNLPNTVIESIACGTPVVGFSVGGIPDMVRPEITGLLAERQDIVELRNNIRRLLENNDLRNSMSASCREVAAKEYSLGVQSMMYSNVYQMFGH